MVEKIKFFSKLWFIFLFLVVSYSINTKKNLKVDARAKLAYEIF